MMKRSPPDVLGAHLDTDEMCGEQGNDEGDYMSQTATPVQIPTGPSKLSPMCKSAYLAVKRRIFSGMLRPKDALVVAKLCKELGMSDTPIRNALVRLEEEQLLTSIPTKGFFVGSLSLVDVREIYEMREVIEGLAARLLARRMSPPQAQMLEALAAEADETSATMADDAAFHEFIFRMCGSRRIAVATHLLSLTVLAYDEHVERRVNVRLLYLLALDDGLVGR